MSGIIKVNTENVQYIATEMENKNKEIKDLIIDIENSVNSLNQECSGQGVTNLVSMFNKIKNNCIEIQYNIINDYVKVLQNPISKGYEETEIKNISLADAFK